MSRYTTRLGKVGQQLTDLGVAPEKLRGLWSVVRDLRALESSLSGARATADRVLAEVNDTSESGVAKRELAAIALARDIVATTSDVEEHTSPLRLIEGGAGGKHDSKENGR